MEVFCLLSVFYAVLFTPQVFFLDVNLKQQKIIRRKTVGFEGLIKKPGKTVEKGRHTYFRYTYSTI